MADLAIFELDPLGAKPADDDVLQFDDVSNSNKSVQVRFDELGFLQLSGGIMLGDLDFGGFDAKNLAEVVVNIGGKIFVDGVAGVGDDTFANQRAANVFSIVAGGIIDSLGGSSNPKGMFEVNRTTGNLDAYNDSQINFAFNRALATPAIGTISSFDWLDLNDATPTPESIVMAQIQALSQGIVDGSESGSLLFKVTQAGTPTPYFQIRGANGDITFSKVLRAVGADFDLGNGNNIRCGTSTGVKISESTSGKIGFWNATPVVQPAHIADATDAADVILRLNDLLAQMATTGLQAAS